MATREYQLIWQDAPGGVSRVYPLEGEDLRVGRSSRCDVVILHPEVSRVHARLFRQEDAYWLEDLGSTNGTWLNKQRLKPHEPVALQSGDIIGLGPHVVLHYYVEEIEAEAQGEGLAEGADTLWSPGPWVAGAAPPSPEEPSDSEAAEEGPWGPAPWITEAEAEAKEAQQEEAEAEAQEGEAEPAETELREPDLESEAEAAAEPAAEAVEQGIEVEAEAEAEEEHEAEASVTETTAEEEQEPPSEPAAEAESAAAVEQEAESAAEESAEEAVAPSEWDAAGLFVAAETEDESDAAGERIVGDREMSSWTLEEVASEVAAAMSDWSEEEEPSAEEIVLQAEEEEEVEAVEVVMIEDDDEEEDLDLETDAAATRRSHRNRRSRRSRNSSFLFSGCVLLAVAASCATTALILGNAELWCRFFSWVPIFTCP